MPGCPRMNLLAEDFMDENPEMKAVNSIYHEDINYHNEESTFNIAGVQYKPRTAALPQQFLGFQ